MDGGEIYQKVVGLGGNDVLLGGTGNNVLDGGAGNDALTGGAGDDTIDAGAGDDFVTAGEGNDTVLGGEGNDTIFAGSGNDTVAGGAGNDTIYGQGGTDVVDGGTGNDRLIGAPGTCTYVFGTGSGHDIIESNQGGTYTIQMSVDVLPSDVIVGRVDQTITLSLNGGFDTLTLPSFYVNHSLQVQFADGTVWDSNTIHNQAGDSRQVGTSGADYLPGYNGFPDELIGLAGDDVYGVNDLGDVVVEAPDEGHDIVYSSVNFTLPDNVEDLFGGGSAATGNALDNFLFGGFYNSVITGGAGDDTLDGGSLYLGGWELGTTDDDTLDGGPGNDTYLFSIYGGIDTILDDSSTGDVNRVQTLTESSNLSLTVKGNALTLVFTGQDYSALEKTHELRISNFDPNDAYGRHAIDLFTFTNSSGIETTLTYSQLIDRGIDVQGTSQDDIVTGTNAPNRIHGGAGNDTLIGGPRNDVYFLDRGDGLDTIIDTVLPGAMNEIRFGDGLNLGDLEVAQGTNSLTIQVGLNGDAIVLSNYDPTGQAGSLVIGSVTFTNGLHLSLDELLNFPGGTNGDDSFSGTDGLDRYNAKGGNDVVTGGGGNDLLLGGSGHDDLKGDAGDDQLFGGAGDDQLNGGIGADELGGGYGNDTLTGGVGDDTVDGGAGSDVYVFNPGDGYDVIHDSAESGESNRLLFGLGITLSNLEFGLSGPRVEDFTIRFINIVYDINTGGSSDGIELPNSWGVDPGLRTISFADGLTLDLFNYYFGCLVQADQNLFASPGHDTLIGGAGNDILHGGAGNSVLIGGRGNNTMIGGTGVTTFYSQSAANNLVFFGSGSNVLVIPAGSGSNTVTVLGVPGSNSVVFGGGYDSFIPNLGFGSLLIRYGSEGGELHIEGFDPNDAYANPGIGTFQFTDQTLTYQQLIDLGFDISGSGEANVLTGSSATDRIKGFGGNDTLESGLGADVLEGGQGDDLLSGGMGNDTYVFNAGSGIDTIQDVAGVGEGNRIQFGTGISQSALSFTHDQAARTLTIQVGSSGTDKLLLTNFDPTGANGSLVVGTLAFADGSSMNLADLFQTAVNHAPTLANHLAAQTVQEDAPVSVVVPSNTFTDQDSGDVLTLSASLANRTALPSWLNFNAATATFSGTPDDAQVGSLDLRVTATDGENLNVSDVFTLTVANVNEAPTVAVSLANQTAVEDAAFTFAVPGSTFADVDSGDVLTYNATLADGTALPTWLSFNSTTRTFSGTPVNSNVGTPALRMTATDTGNLSASDTFSLTVTNVNDAPTVANPIVDQTAHTGAAFTFTVPTNIFADVDLGDTLTYNATLADGGTLPAWLNFNSMTRTFNGTPSSGDTGLVNIKITATDAGSLSMSDLFDLTVTIQDQVLTGTAGSDVLAGGAGNDQLFGLAGNDTFQGGAGNDLLDGGTGTDTMLGGIGNDIYIINVAGDVVTELGNEGTDTVQSSITSTLGANVENLTLTGTVNLNGTGNALDNVLTGNSGVNVLTGGAGNDTLDGRLGADTMTGGTGNDTYVVDATGDVVTENVNEGMDTVQSSVTYMLAANVENLTLTGTAAINGTGNALDNILAGNSAANTLTGGTGNDIYVVSTGDTVVEQANQGLDTVQSGVTWTLGANLEALTLTGTSNINGTSNALNNLLTGNSGANVLTGGAGNDVYVVNMGDTVVEAVNAGTDTVLSGVTTTLSTNVELLGLTGTNAINGTGNSLNNVLTGNNAANVLDGGAGADTLAGLDGNDTYLVDNTGDAIIELANNGTDLVQSSVTYTLAANVENLTLTGSTAINGTGNTLDNLLIGNCANNMLTGGAGNDTLDGGAGNDTMVGGTGNDTYGVAAAGDVVTENANEGTDTVQSSITYTLGANAENLTLTGTVARNGTGNILDNQVIGNSANNTLSGANGNDILRGGLGNDTANGGSGNDTFLFDRGDGQDLVQDNSGSADKMLFDGGINPLDFVISRQANDVRLTIHGSSDQITVQNWYTSSVNRTETIQAGNGQTLLNTQVDQLIQAMAGFTAQTGLTWDQAIDQRPQEVQTVLAASWQ